MRIFLQHIQTSWTKNSRGNPLSQKRNSTPESELFSGPLDEGKVVLQKSEYAEQNLFERTFATILEPTPDERNGLGIYYKEFEKLLFVTFCWSWQFVGAPERRTHEVMRLAAGEYGRILFNGRFGAQSSTGQEWVYMKSVVNIIYADSIVPDSFLTQEPCKVFESLEDLH